MPPAASDEQQALGERQAREPHPARADGGPDRELPAALADARQHEVGDVHAGDQQEGGHRADEQPGDARGIADPPVAHASARAIPRACRQPDARGFGPWDSSISAARSGVTSGLSRASTVIDVGTGSSDRGDATAPGAGCRRSRTASRSPAAGRR